MNHLVNDSKSSVTSIKTSSSASILGVNGDGSVAAHKNATDIMTDGHTISRSTSDKYSTNFHKTDPSKNAQFQIFLVDVVLTELNVFFISFQK